MGCSSSPPALTPPDIDPHKFAASAIEKHDSSGDGVIDGNELKSAPSLKFSAQRIDLDKDQKITADELVAFAQTQWIDVGAGMILLHCDVSLDGRPLDGATVTLEPEPFMEGAVMAASGVTRGGSASLDISNADRPHPNAHGVQNGMYKVRISKMVNGREMVPAKYNAQTTLGCEVAARASYMPGPIAFKL